ncbi:MAG: hypothetical protein IT452_13355 [Planctomycetia bacterium]|nr:hypothetical protein [Planctomycetia bacterium]
MRLALVPAFLLAASAVFAGDKDKKEKPAQIPADYVHFASSWEAAKAEAKERNVPIHVAFHKDH